MKWNELGYYMPRKKRNRHHSDIDKEWHLSYMPQLSATAGDRHLADCIYIEKLHSIFPFL